MSSKESSPPYAAMALAITSQDWTSLGLDDDPNVAPSDDLELTVDRIVSLLVPRIVAIHAPKGKYQDLSTTTICRTSLMADRDDWPEPVTDSVIGELRNKQKPRLFGLRSDPLMHLTLIWSALAHDVEHQGIPNRQLALEDDELAILYNDQSIAENRSLTVAFKELLKKDYETLRKAIFINDEEYRRFRKQSTQLILMTDIASPERTQIRKSKWKEAFGEDFQTVEAKIKSELKRRSSAVQVSQPPSRRMSAVSILDELQQLPDIVDSLTNTPEASENSESISDYDKTFVAVKPVTQESPVIPGFSARNPSMGTVSTMGSGGLGPTPAPPTSAAGRTTSEQSLGYSDNFKRFQHRVSAATGHQRRFRLGIHRSIDLSGEFIETYSRRSTMSTHAHMQALGLDEEEVEEEYDDLKTSVILEQIITAADIAHVLQGWHQMEKWSNRLFLELKKAHKEGRGPHPKPNWYENQIGFLESYNLPLAQKMEDMGVFGPLIGPVFARLVEANRDQWLVDGETVTADIIAKGAELFPVADD